MAVSQNGWEVIPSPSGTQKWTIGNTGRHYFLRSGDAGFVLACLVLWFHRNVERINAGIWDEWGWAYRPIRGRTSGFSNHASGTAIDINATLHPLGRSWTFKHAWQYVKIKARMVWCLGVITWGGGWSRPDEMHFEISRGVPTARLNRLAKRWMKTSAGKAIAATNPHYTPPTTVGSQPGTRNLRVGDRGPDVRFVQDKVGASVDGVYGEQTAAAVRRWERAKKGRFPALKVNGAVEKVTWLSLGVKPKY